MSPAPIAGTANAAGPFFSPDSQWIAFFADGQLKKVPVAGGTPVTLCEAPVGLGGSWSADDVIVFAAATGSGLSQVSAAGGTPQRLTMLDVAQGEFSHRWPEWLPDGETVLFTIGTSGSWSDAQIVAQSVASGRRTILVRGGTNPHYLPTGSLIYAQNGRIMRVPFNTTDLTVGGSPIAVLDNVLQSADGAAQLSVAPIGERGVCHWGAGCGSAAARVRRPRWHQRALRGAARFVCIAEGLAGRPEAAGSHGRAHPGSLGVRHDVGRHRPAHIWCGGRLSRLVS